MEIGAREHDEDSTHKLYEASLRGSVRSLNTLMQSDSLILRKTSLTSLRETPLHISALLGHLDFTKALLNHKPELAKELDSLKHSPLHLAAAEGHVQIVKELLLANKDACLVADQDGRIPLHLAAMRGRVEVVQELISANFDSALVKFHGDTVLHLCVRYNHLEALKIMLRSLLHDEGFLNSKNHQGYSILELSATLKQFQTTSYLLSIPQIRVDVNSLIENGFTMLQKDLQEAIAVPSTKSETKALPLSPNVTLHHRDEPQAQAALRQLFKFDSDRYEKTRGNLMVVATLIATMSFQVAVNPPGGFWQADTKADQGCPSGQPICKAGTAVQAYKTTNDYRIFIACSTVSFSASMGIMLLLISGVPLKNKVSVGILILGMFISVFFAAATYMMSIGFVKAPHDKSFFDSLVGNYYVRFWVGLLCVIVGIHVLRICWWLLKKIGAALGASSN
ncbi:ANK REP REGION domain-containing protein [Citrus sinensis]|nr:ANK REP REGION domain-containing protein [Citrus sinensis]